MKITIIVILVLLAVLVGGTLTWELAYDDYAETAKEIAEFSAAGKVPILQLDDVTIWDSLAIAETVAERWPEKKLWPEDPGERAHARAISAEMHSGFVH